MAGQTVEQGVARPGGGAVAGLDLARAAGLSHRLQTMELAAYSATAPRSSASTVAVLLSAVKAPDHYRSPPRAVIAPPAHSVEPAAEPSRHSVKPAVAHDAKGVGAVPAAATGLEQPLAHLKALSPAATVVRSILPPNRPQKAPGAAASPAAARPLAVGVLAQVDWQLSWLDQQCRARAALSQYSSPARRWPLARGHRCAGLQPSAAPRQGPLLWNARSAAHRWASPPRADALPALTSAPPVAVVPCGHAGQTRQHVGAVCR